MADPFFNHPDPSSQALAYGFAFLPDWGEDEWVKLLQFTASRSATAGETLIRPGDTDRHLYIVAEGRLQVLRPRGWFGRRTVVHECETGGIIGEQAFVDGRPRSALVRAAEASRLASITPDAFEAFSSQHPALARRFLLDLARILSLRLRQASIAVEHSRSR